MNYSEKLGNHCFGAQKRFSSCTMFGSPSTVSAMLSMNVAGSFGFSKKLLATTGLVNTHFFMIRNIQLF